MKFIQDIYEFKEPFLKGCAVAVVYCISNAAGNRLHGEKFAEMDLCNKTIDMFGTKICVWTMTHFVMHFIAAYEYETSTMTQMFVGFYWEFIEEYIIDHLPYMKSNCNVGTYEGNYWRAEPKDIIMNTLGMLAGQKLRSYCGTPTSKYLMEMLIGVTLAHNLFLHMRQLNFDK